jgi:hypothetical protein
MLGLAALIGRPAQADVVDTTFYELTENSSLDGTTRIGTGALAGRAKVRQPEVPGWPQPDLGPVQVPV